MAFWLWLWALLCWVRLAQARPCRVCDLVSKPLNTGTGLHLGVVSFRYYSTTNEVCFTSETYDGWKFSTVNIEVTSERITTPNLKTFQYQSEVFRSTYFARCLKPKQGSIKCGDTKLYLYFQFEVHMTEDDKATRSGWADGTPFKGDLMGT